LVFNNFISNTNGLCISVAGVDNAVVVNNICVDANAVPYIPGFNATYCGAKSKPIQQYGSNQPWCPLKVAAQGAIVVSHSKNVDMSSSPNTFLGTTLGGFK
jgi:hypothetical protein